ncbi:MULTISPECIES: hypothetical protein [unclassified Microbacterium]|uniref:hypothetical protein n=1 Tax=unclassified Microbacterium TaxID=2609290 RepID=UPI0016568F29|nr:MULTISPECIES: hypothetical protein [unclassified Microbacterium]MDH5131610.1 hypothetical protein [Microbacterium sp. RD10]MDH5135111.1 hypothetical protein [Microbacterium sp. RD11]MDH5144475.1 hypothetical protein [Microbacterium sp. RD12]MDH5153419.1 hypothetical protein [Microbacterium sp. RD06]MDH5165202.1 hypothetical protein [Microbacterium sp. RD02]
MSTSDQRGPLTRKQLREIRLTGSTPIISEEQASAAAAEAATPAPPLPRAAEPVVLPSAPVADTSVDPDAAPLTRRQAREQEKIKTAAVPAVDAEADDTTDEAVVAQHDGSDDDVVDDEVAAEPVRAADVADTVGDVPLVEEPVEAPESEPEDISAVLGVSEQDGPGGEDLLDSDSDDDGDVDERDVDEAERPTVSPTFGQGVLQEETPAEPAPFRPSFDELLTSNDSGGTQHSAPNALIFTPSPGEGSLSGPVASTGEILVTGSYELPKGLGSQGHAHGTTDGKEVDAVLIDGELPPASSPTPIAASSAVSTIKPAGEVIRPPAPEKGNRLMLIAAIVAGALALGLGTALVIAFTGNVF